MFFAAIAGARIVSSLATDVARGGVGFSPDTVDLGAVPTQQVVRSWLHFRNGSDNPLELVEFETSCGCATVRPLPPIVIEAGSTLTIELSVDSMHIVGSIRREISARASTGRLFPCWIDLEVERSFSCTPDSLDFGDVSREAEPCQTLTVCSPYADFGEPICDSTWIEARAESDERGTLVDVTVIGELMPMGRVLGHVVIPLRTPEQQHVFVPVRARRIDALPQADDVRARVRPSEGEVTGSDDHGF